MPFAFKKKNKRREIPKDIILCAIEEVSKGAQIKTTAKKYDIPRSNLQRYLKQGTVKDVSSKYISNQFFTEDEEEKFTKYLTTSSKLNYGVTKMQTRQLAYEYACELNKKIPENWIKNRIASKDWIRGFLKRQPQLSIRTQVSQEPQAKQTIPNKVPAAPLINQNQSEVDLTSLSKIVAPGPSQSKSPIQNVNLETMVITPDFVRPYTKAGPRKLTGMNRKRGKSRILTDSPEIRIIEIAEQERQRKNKKK